VRHEEKLINVTGPGCGKVRRTNRSHTERNAAERKISTQSYSHTQSHSHDGLCSTCRFVTFAPPSKDSVPESALGELINQSDKRIRPIGQKNTTSQAKEYVQSDKPRVVQKVFNVLKGVSPWSIVQFRF